MEGTVGFWAGWCGKGQRSGEYILVRRVFINRGPEADLKFQSSEVRAKS